MPLLPRSLRLIAAGLLLAGATSCAVDVTGAVSPVASDYQKKLADYEQVHGPYEQAANAYWDAVADKRRLRNAKRRNHQPIGLDDYVLTQPPVYTGPPKPIDPNAPPPQPGERPEIPVIADFLKAAAEEWHFVPDRPRSELEFKHAYGEAALAAGLTREQIIGVYAFETGGTGTYDTQAGVTPTRPKAISPALGYNQLLTTNTVSLLAENGGDFIAALRHKARMLTGEAKHHLDSKIETLKRMVAFSRSIPHRWSEYDRIAKTTAQGIGIHAILLDIDIGPLLQVQKLTTSIRFARVKGYLTPLTPAELELMNLTGDGNGIDMVTMPQAFRDQVPTANFFQPNGYDRNPVAKRTKVVAGLIAEIAGHMTHNAQNAGAKELAAAF